MVQLNMNAAILSKSASRDSFQCTKTKCTERKKDRQKDRYKGRNSKRERDSRYGNGKTAKEFNFTS